MSGKSMNIWIAAAFLTLPGCAPDGPALEQEFTESSSVCFTVRGEVEHRFDPLDWQAVYSPSKCEFTVCNDNMSDFYTLRCSALPRQGGDEVKCDVTWTTYSDIKKKSGIRFKVTRADSATGVLWMWSSSELIGAAVIAVE